MRLSNIKNNQIFGHDWAKQLFLDAFNNNRLPHSWLIYGSKGIGKSTLIFQFIKFLFSNNCANLDVINDTNKKIEASSHPDFLIIDAYLKENEEKKQPIITVDEIRKISKFLQLTTCESPYKIVMIRGAEHMNINASNAILKLLEEPPKNSYIFLVSNRIVNILPTIRSRCALLSIKNLSFNNFLSAIRINIDSIDDHSAQKLFSLSGGSVSIAISMYENLDFVRGFDQLFDSKSIHEIVNFCDNTRSIQDNWIILKYIVISKVVSTLKQNLNIISLDTINRIDYLNNLQNYLSDAETYHLDKSQFILSFLTSFQS